MWTRLGILFFLILLTFYTITGEVGRSIFGATVMTIVIGIVAGMSGEAD